MALTEQTISGAVVTKTTLAAVTSTTETISAPGPGVVLEVTFGATTTTTTIVRPGTLPAGDANSDFSAAYVSVTKFFPIGREYKDSSTGLATVQFSQITNVTALLQRHTIA